MTTTQDPVADALSPGSTARSGWSPVVTLLVVVAVFGYYTAVAFQLDLQTVRGHVGPGLFPRVIGTLGLTFTALAILRQLRASGHRGPGARGATVTTTLAPAVLMGVTSVLLVVLFEPLGAVLSGFCFLLVNLSFLNRGGHLVNVGVAVVFPLATYLLIATALGAPMPTGPFAGL